MTKPAPNMHLAATVIEALRATGVSEFVVCAGARNAPFVELLGQPAGVQVYRFFEERSAGFFALGRIKASTLVGHARPVAVVTTSGTAAAELLPAVIEAHYSGLPLVLVTADRPRSYRATGAPQAIEQVGLYSHYVAQGLDLEASPAVGDKLAQALSSWEHVRPLHVNVCFAEPLVDGPVEVLRPQSSPPQSSPPQSSPLSPSVQSRSEQMQQFAKRCRRPLAIVGSLRQSEMSGVVDFLRRERLPILAEALSQLCGRPDLREQTLWAGEASLRHAVANGEVDGILRFGGVPTLRLWRDLEDRLCHLPVLSLTPTGFSGLSRKDALTVHLSQSLSDIADERHFTNDSSCTFARDRQLAAGLEKLLAHYPQSEPSLMRGLLKILPEKCRLYLGNSMPIREWDLVASGQVFDFAIEGNRGANGIDGQVSTFLGFAGEASSNWCVLGDLTTLYDLSAPWALRERPLHSANIVTINNGGGQIFNRVFHNQKYTNAHGLNFEHWAKMFDLDYVLIEHPTALRSLIDGRQVIEVRPHAEQTELFWENWEQLSR